MSQARLSAFLEKVRVANPGFHESRSSLKKLLAEMRRQVTAGVYDLAALAAGLASARADTRGAKYETALAYVERVWGHPELQVKGPSATTWSDLPATLYVLKGTALSFREVDTDATASHTFTAASTSSTAAGAVSVPLVFGASQHTVKAIVYELTPAVTFVDEFTNRSRTHVGVNEPMTLGFTTTPAGVTAANAGGLLWKLPPNHQGETPRQFLGKLQKTATDVGAPATDGTAYYVAPWCTDTAMPKNPRPSSLTSAVTLHLEIQGGVNRGQQVDLTLTVHTPVARMVVAARCGHVHGKPSAGFLGDIFFDPKNVSFHFVQFREGRGTMQARQTGFRAPIDLSRPGPPRQLPTPPAGYFAGVGFALAHGVLQAQIHQHTAIWVPISRGNAVTGCKLVGQDTVRSGWNPVYPAVYPATAGAELEGKATNEPSEELWPIYWKYKVPEIAEDVLAQQAQHRATMDATGAVTMSKAGASVTRALNDPTDP